MTEIEDRDLQDISMWNYRVMRRIYKDNQEEYITYQIYEVYYDATGTPKLWTLGPTEPTGETVEELREDLQRMLAALDKPVLEYDDKKGL